MADMENELKDLREKNNELVQKVQYWKMTAAQRENEKLELMKEINELRLKLSRLRSGGAAHARKLDAALQTASEEALSHLVQASSAVARTLELAKTYMQDRQELESALPRWSSLSNTPSSDKVNRVPPMLIGGRLMQPVVSLSRTLQSNNSRSVNRSPNQQNRSVSERAVPMHMLQDVYIPLTRIDAGELPANNVDTDMEVNHADDSTEELALDGNGDRLEESQNSDTDNFEESRRLDAVTEDIEPEDEELPQRQRAENPLEGPSWLLDEPRTKRKTKKFTNLEPDSTTEFEENLDSTPTPGPSQSSRQTERGRRSEFSPTVRRRRASPPASPRPRRLSNNGRILKVLVAKMRLDEDEGGDGDASPPKRPNLDSMSPMAAEVTPRTSAIVPEASPKRQSRDGSPRFQIREMSPSKRLMRFDAPSPNGSTDSRVIVLETRNDPPEPCSSGISISRTINRVNNFDNQSNNNINDHDPISSDQNQNENDRNTRRNHSCVDNRSGKATSQSRENNISLDNHSSLDNRGSRPNNHTSLDNRGSRDSRDSDSSGSELASESRTRRPRKAVVYKEKPLNRKLRR
ncbi:probable serine/threonine-protein kinase tsuA isoform X2 [Vanessa tameamea]|uniref:Probable serine/threonine-protein kinase tsuA isoform X2 n=1 Tax=Vanessa tameamea TaxID=334116 RepID=A0ABM4AZP7_VANTA